MGARRVAGLQVNGLDRSSRCERVGGGVIIVLHDKILKFGIGPNQSTGMYQLYRSTDIQDNASKQMRRKGAEILIDKLQQVLIRLLHYHHCNIVVGADIVIIIHSMGTLAKISIWITFHHHTIQIVIDSANDGVVDIVLRHTIVILDFSRHG